MCSSLFESGLDGSMKSGLGGSMNKREHHGVSQIMIMVSNMFVNRYHAMVAYVLPFFI